MSPGNTRKDRLIGILVGNGWLIHGHPRPRSTKPLPSHEVYLSRGLLVGFSPSPPNAVCPTLRTFSLSTLFTTFNYQIPMAYFNNTNDASFHSTSYTSGELDAYPVLSLVSATEEANSEAPGTFTNGWGVGGQPGYTVGSPTSLRAEPSFGEHDYALLNGRGLTCVSPGSVPPVPPYTVHTPGYDHLPYSEHYWPITGRDAQYYRSSIVSRDNSFASTAVLEAPTVIPAPSSSKCLFSPTRLWEIEYSSTANSPVRLLGSQRERAVHHYVLPGICPSAIIFAQPR